MTNLRHKEHRPQFSDQLRQRGRCGALLFYGEVEKPPLPFKLDMVGQQIELRKQVEDAQGELQVGFAR